MANNSKYIDIKDLPRFPQGGSPIAVPNENAFQFNPRGINSGNIPFQVKEPNVDRIIQVDQFRQKIELDRDRLEQQKVIAAANIAAKRAALKKTKGTERDKALADALKDSRISTKDIAKDYGIDRTTAHGAMVWEKFNKLHSKAQQASLQNTLTYKGTNPQLLEFNKGKIMEGLTGFFTNDKDYQNHRKMIRQKAAIQKSASLGNFSKVRGFDMTMELDGMLNLVQGVDNDYLDNFDPASLVSTADATNANTVANIQAFLTGKDKITVTTNDQGDTSYDKQINDITNEEFRALVAQTKASYSQDPDIMFGISSDLQLTNKAYEDVSKLVNNKRVENGKEFKVFPKKDRAATKKKADTDGDGFVGIPIDADLPIQTTKVQDFTKKVKDPVSGQEYLVTNNQDVITTYNDQASEWPFADGSNDNAGAGDFTHSNPEINKEFKENIPVGDNYRVFKMGAADKEDITEDKKSARQATFNKGSAVIDQKVPSDIDQAGNTTTTRFDGTGIAASNTDSGSGILPQSFLAAIDSTEANNAVRIKADEDSSVYDTLFANSDLKGSKFADTKVSELTVEEVLEFQVPSGKTGTYGRYVKDKLKELGEHARVATPAGKYQIVGTKLKELIKDGVVKKDELFSPEVQDRAALYIAKKRIAGKTTQKGKRQALRNEWEGFAKSLTNEELDTIISDIESGGEIEQKSTETSTSRSPFGN